MDLRDIEQAAIEQGWRVDRTKIGHPVFYPLDPDMGPIFGSGTPSDWRSIRNLLAKLKSAGRYGLGRQPRGEHGSHEGMERRAAGLDAGAC
jgi:hypothetical protein